MRGAPRQVSRGDNDDSLEEERLLKRHLVLYRAAQKAELGDGEGVKEGGPHALTEVTAYLAT